MIYTLHILRRRGPDTAPYLQTFIYEAQKETDTVASALADINRRPDLRDREGNPADQIRWECSCLQKKCGACAMVIDGRPCLACDYRLAEAGKDEIRIEPLRKFPVIADLMVDRSILFENLKTMQCWLKEEADLPDDCREMAYRASECLQCGCCLEICPNFYVGGRFFGMAAVPVTTRLLTGQSKEDYRDLARQYSGHVFEGCGKSLACANVCPKKIDTEELLVHANALAIWKRKGGYSRIFRMLCGGDVNGSNKKKGKR